MTERDIGLKLGRTHNSVHDAVKSVYSALDINSRTQLIRLWHDLDAPIPAPAPLDSADEPGAPEAPDAAPAPQTTPPAARTR
ncbi:hypothetical protein BH11PLA1_BH11PLA1_03650 [soil metagenome]